MLIVLPALVAAMDPLVGPTFRSADLPASRNLQDTPAGRKLLVAHRGASAYAPEHTLAAYRLALEQGADFVEQDLAVTKDGALICLHDATLERTTDVEDKFPDRFSTGAKGEKRWLANDLTLAEIRTLDAGSWFDPRFAGERVPTFREAIDLVRGKAGLFPELKDPQLYRDRGIDMTELVAAELTRAGLDTTPADAPHLILQSFDAATIEALATRLPGLPRVLLLDARGADAFLTDDGLTGVKRYATGIGPTKTLLLRDPDVVARAHAAGLTVVPYTFRSAATGHFPSVREEMSYFLYQLGVDGLFTDNPDQFPRSAP